LLEREGDLVERDLAPLLSPGDPKRPACLIALRPRAAKFFLTADFSQPLHSFHSIVVKPLNDAIVTEFQRSRAAVCVNSDIVLRCEMSIRRRAFSSR
jgi:hypothetical protein